MPPYKVINRHYKSIINCARMVSLLDKIYIYDNSVNGKSPKLIFRIINYKNNKILKQYETLHNWSKNIYQQFNSKN